MRGNVEQLGDGFVITFERQLRHSPDQVWDALTSDDRIAQWLAGPGSSIELRVGGRVHLTGHEIESTVVDLDPPRVLEFGFAGKDWDGGTARWELTPSGTGTRLVLIHRNPTPMDPAKEREIVQRHGIDPDEYPTVPRTMAGWHTLLDALEGLLDGAPALADDHWQTTYDRDYAKVKI
jgi:uncharacterized protein YndB with AHSA1/START domain